jgi:hypothetical protein
MNHERWIVGSHRSVDRLFNGKRAAICEVNSGAADSLEQADAFQCLIAAAPDLLRELQTLVTGLTNMLGSENAEGVTQAARDAIAKATCNIHEARTAP